MPVRQSKILRYLSQICFPCFSPFRYMGMSTSLIPIQRRRPFFAKKSSLRAVSIIHRLNRYSIEQFMEV
jgi:hypothetical protein